jgi:transposase
VSDATSETDAATDARIAELEQALAAERARGARLEAEHDRLASETERLASQLDRLVSERDQLREAYELLKQQVELAHRRLVIAKAERIDTTQLELEFATQLAALGEAARMAMEAEAAAGGGGSRTKKREKANRQGRRDLRLCDLPEERLEIPDPVLDGTAPRIGTEESVALRWRRGGFVRLVVVRFKYAPEATPTASSADDASSRTAIVTAPMPPRILDRSFATPSMLAHVANEKFGFGMPLHRQEEKFAAIGVPIDRSTMSRWLEEVGAIAGATIVEAMRREALVCAFCIATDATGIRVQPTPRDDKQHQACRRAHFFVQIADADHVFFEYTPEENSEVVQRMFEGFSGFVQADAKSVFNVLYRPPKDREPIDDTRSDLGVRSEVGCWSHARTKHWEAAVATQDVVAREALARIMIMFRLERAWKNKLPDVRKTLRERHLRPHLDAFFAFVEPAYEDVKHQRGMLRSALGYCVRQKDALLRFLDDGRLEMTNNHSERQLRKIATGRNAWLFVGSDDHGQATGNLLSLIASARLHKLDPEAYLRDVFRVIPHWPRDRFIELAPRYWPLTRARLDREQLDRELGPLTVPEQPLPTIAATTTAAP